MKQKNKRKPSQKNHRFFGRQGNKKMSFITKLAYEFLPTTDQSLLEIDKEIAQL